MATIETGSSTSGLNGASPGCGLFTPPEWIAIKGAFKLSRREFEVLQSVFDDLAQRQIALRLGISTHTVHTHIERLYKKLGVSSRGELLVRVFAHHLKAIGARDAASRSNGARSALKREDPGAYRHAPHSDSSTTRSSNPTVRSPSKSAGQPAQGPHAARSSTRSSKPTSPLSSRSAGQLAER